MPLSVAKKPIPRLRVEKARGDVQAIEFVVRTICGIPANVIRRRFEIYAWSVVVMTVLMIMAMVVLVIVPAMLHLLGLRHGLPGGGWRGKRRR